MRALPHGMIGLAGTNALPTMAPWGGLDKIVGMNPLAIAFPTAEEPPLVLDVAFGMTAHGKIRVYQQKGHPIPEGWAIPPLTSGIDALLERFDAEPFHRVDEQLLGRARSAR